MQCTNWRVEVKKNAVYTLERAKTGLAPVPQPPVETAVEPIRIAKA